MQPLEGPRDQLPQGRTIHALLLTYKLSLEAEGKHRVTVPMLNRYAAIMNTIRLLLSLCLNRRTVLVQEAVCVSVCDALSVHVPQALIT